MNRAMATVATSMCRSVAFRAVKCTPARAAAVRASMSRPNRNLATGAMDSAAGVEWNNADTRRMLHVVYRVGDIDATTEYYKKHFGMTLLRYRDFPEEKYTNSFLGFGPEESNFAVELTYNYGVDKYDIGEGFGHFGIATTDVYKMVDSIKAEGGIVTREPGPVKGGTTHIAFVKDPTGYPFELIQRAQPSDEPFAQVMLRVTDLDASIKYYQDCLGMHLIRKRENAEYKYTLAFMGYGAEEATCVLELTYNWGRTEPYAKGDAYAQIAIGSDDVFRSCHAIRAAGGAVLREAFEIASIGTKIMATADPDGYKIVLVDNKDFQRELDLAPKASE